VLGRGGFGALAICGAGAFANIASGLEEEEGGEEPWKGVGEWCKGGFPSEVARSPAPESVKGSAETSALVEGDTAETCYGKSAKEVMYH